MSQMQDWMQLAAHDREAPARVPRPHARHGSSVGIGALVTMIAGLMPWAEGTVPGRAGLRADHLLGPRRRGRRRRCSSCSRAASRSSSCTARRPRRGCGSCTRSRTCSSSSPPPASSPATAPRPRRSSRGRTAADRARSSLGLYLAALGIVIMGVGLAALLPGLIRWRRASDDPADLMTVSRRGVAESIAGLAGILVGGALGIQLAVSMTPVPVIGLIALGAVFGGAARRLRGLVDRALDRRRGIATAVAPTDRG